MAENTSPTKSPQKKKQRPTSTAASGSSTGEPRSLLFDIFTVSPCGLACKVCTNKTLVTLKKAQTIQVHAQQHRPHVTHGDAVKFQAQAWREISKKVAAEGLSSFVDDQGPRVRVALCSCGKDLKDGSSIRDHLNKPANRGHVIRGEVVRITTICGRDMTMRALEEASNEVNREVERLDAEAEARRRSNRPTPSVGSTQTATRLPIGPTPSRMASLVPIARSHHQPPRFRPANNRLFSIGNPVVRPGRVGAFGRVVASGRTGRGSFPGRHHPPRAPVQGFDARSSHPSAITTGAPKGQAFAIDDFFRSFGLRTGDGDAAPAKPTADDISQQNIRSLAGEQDFKSWTQFSNTEPLETFIASIMADDEEAEHHVPLFLGWYEALDEREGTPEEQLLYLADMVQKDVDKETEPLLAKLIHAIPEWISNIPRATNRVPGNYRTTLNNWTQAAKTGCDSVAHTSPYTCRHIPSSFKKPLEQFLKFVCRVERQSKLFKHHLDKAAADHSFQYVAGFITPLLVAAMLEGGNGPESAAFEPMFLRFLLGASCKIVTSFRDPNSSTSGTTRVAKLRSCESIGKLLSAGLSLLKASGVIHLMEQTRLLSNPNAFRMDPQDFVELASTSVLFNKLGPGIHRMRGMNERKPKPPPSLTSDDGDITVHQHEFPHEVWTDFIPRVLAKSTDLLGLYFVCYPDWLRFVDLRNAVVVQWIPKIQEFDVVAREPDGRTTRLSDIPVSKVQYQEAMLDRIIAYMRLVFDMFGVGAARATEIERLMMSNLMWFNGTIHYRVHVLKSGTYELCGSTRGVPHQLPREAARHFLVFRHVLRRVTGELRPRCFPEVTKDSHFCRALEEVFDLPTKLDARHARQFCSAIANFISKELSKTLTAHPLLARLYGHSHKTHDKSYSTHMAEYDAILAQVWHRSLGYEEKSNGGTVDHNDLVRALKRRFGSNAKYTSPLQSRLALSSTDNSMHVLALLACGEGKSQAWELLLLASLHSDKPMKSIIVVAPYKFLAKTILGSAVESLRIAGFEKSIDAVCWLPADITEKDVPPQLKVPGFLPKLVVTTPDWLVKVEQLHPGLLASHKDYIHRIFLDEIHTMVNEATFRPCYDIFKTLPRYKIPITVLSATLPEPMQGPLLRHINLAPLHGPPRVKVIGECQPSTGSYSPGFDFRVERLKDPVQRTVSEALRRLRMPHGDTRPRIHIVCSSVKDAEATCAKLSEYKVGLVTAGVLDEDLEVIAAKWKAGELDALVTTTIGLVGNECSECQTLIVCGYVYNLANLAQAIGRLRRSQRRDGGLLLICLPEHPPPPHLVQADHDRCTRLLAKGLLSDDAVKLFNSVFTIWGLHAWAGLGGCRLRRLNESFGSTRERCLVCDNCRTRPVAVVATQAQAQVASERSVRSQVQSALARLRVTCIECGRSFCNGDNCAEGSCFQCGSRYHRTDVCPIKAKYKTFGSYFCPYCLDCRARPGYEKHDVKNCPLQRRLRRVLINGFQRRHSRRELPPRLPNTTDGQYNQVLDEEHVKAFALFLNDTLASEETYNQFVLGAFETARR